MRLGALIQLAKRRGADAIAMASEAKFAGVARPGPDRIPLRAPEDLCTALEGQTVAVVVDVDVNHGWLALIEVLSGDARYMCSGAVAGSKMCIA